MERTGISLKAKPYKPFRAFVSNKYYENRDEYQSFGQQQPYSYEQYVKGNLALLKDMYRADKRKYSGGK